MQLFYASMIFLVFWSQNVEAWSDKKVKLTDVQTLTLYNGKMTTGRRSSPVPQAQCVGGSAGCSSFIPQVIQCYNRGSDGIDVQWECKTDMDNAYRFGRIDVVCEGYDYPDDVYVLKGSCGLEYTLDLTKEGKESSYGSSYYKDTTTGFKPQKSGKFSDLVIIAVALLIMYGLYKTCVSQQQRSRTNDDFNDQSGNGRGYGFPSAPPPPGFRTNYSDEGCARSNSYQQAAPSAGGFWTGAATGGMLGYMFGNRNSGQTSFFQQPTTDARSRSQSWGGGFESGSASSGTRSASGYGGTRRR